MIGTIIKHDKYGEGRIIDFDGKTAIIDFEDKKGMRVAYPDGFTCFTTNSTVLDEQARIDMANKMIVEERRQQERAYKLKTEAESKNIKPSRATTPKVPKGKKAPKEEDGGRHNVAFKCNFCDGGATQNSYGFSGVCSDCIIDNNIYKANYNWCNRSACLKYKNNEITREELDAQNESFVCYESRMFIDWKASAGVSKQNKPMPLKSAAPDHLGVLTTRLPETKEQTRHIFAVFLISESHEGDSFLEGYAKAQQELKIALTPDEAKQILFWKYHSNENSDRMVWSTGLYRYLDNSIAAQILLDILEVKKGKSDYELAQKLLDHYCDIHKIDIEALPKPSGALTKKL